MRTRVSVVLGLMTVLLPLGRADAKPAACPAARFVVPGKTLISGSTAPANDQIEINGSQIVVASGCGPAPVRLAARKKFTLVTAKFASCAGLAGKATLKAKIPYPACNTLKGALTTKKGKPKQRKFTANRVPTFRLPAPMTVGPEGGTFTNPDDGTQVTVPPGAFAEGERATITLGTGGNIAPLQSQTASVSVVEVPIEQVVAMEQALGLQPPSGFQLLKALQVGLGVNDPHPRLALTASIPEPPGLDPSAELIHTLIEPTFIEGYMDPRKTNLIYDGKIMRQDGRLFMQIAPQQFGSPPGRTCGVVVPPLCCVDGVVRDSNGSPIGGALVFAEGTVLKARTNSGGFYTIKVGGGPHTIIATSGGLSGQTSITCNANEKICAPVIVLAVAANAAVPRVNITVPAMDTTVPPPLTTFAIEGRVASVNPISQVAIETHISDTADPLVQTANLSPATDCPGPPAPHCASFSQVVILTSGAPNTVIVTAQDGQLFGADSRVFFLGGRQPDDLKFTLTWDTMDTDVDLYVRTPGAQTLYYANRAGGGGQLDVDDTNGLGPENVTFTHDPANPTPPGAYAFAAQYFRGTIPTRATITVRLNGRVLGAMSATLSSAAPTSPIAAANPATVFNAGTVEFPGSPTQLPGPPIPNDQFH